MDLISVFVVVVVFLFVFWLLVTGPSALQGSLSPVGTFVSTRSTVWSITYDQAVRIIQVIIAIE